MNLLGAVIAQSSLRFRGKGNAAGGGAQTLGRFPPHAVADASGGAAGVFAASRAGRADGFGGAVGARPPLGQAAGIGAAAALLADRHGNADGIGNAVALSSPSFVNSGVFPVNAGLTSITPPLPSPRSNGNMLFAFCRVAGSPTIVVGGGWTLVDNFLGSGAANVWAWRIVDGTEAAPVFSWTGANTAMAMALQIAGASPSLPYGTVSHAAGTASPITAPSITTAKSNSLILVYMASAGSTPLPTPSGYANQAANGPNAGAVNEAATQITILQSGQASTAISFAYSSVGWVSQVLEIVSY
jgi:hypothetical protein